MNVLGAALAVLLGMVVVCDASIFQYLWAECRWGRLKSEQIDAIKKSLVEPLKDLFSEEPIRLGLGQANPMMTNWMNESWQMSVMAGEVRGLPTVQFGQLQCSFKKSWLDGQCTLGISFAHLTFEFVDLLYRVDAGEKRLDGRNNVTYEGVHFDIVLTRESSNNTLHFEGLDCRFSYVQHVMALETEQDLNSSLTKLELYCLLEFLMSNIKHTVEQEDNRNKLLAKVNTRLLKSNGKTDAIEAYDQLMETSLEESGEFETILIRPLKYLFLKAFTQFQLKTFNQNFMNWQTEVWFISVDSGEISGLSSVLFDNLLCGLSVHNETEWTVNMHFKQLSFEFFNLTYQVAWFKNRTIPGRTTVDYKDVYFNIIVSEKGEKGNEVVFSDMHCNYKNRALANTETKLSNTLAQLYLDKFLMANVEHYIQKDENKQRYLKAANDLALEIRTKANRYNISELYHTQLFDLAPQQLDKSIEELFLKNARPSPLALLALNTELTNWPDEIWRVKVYEGQIRNLASVKSDTLSCSYNRRSDECVCTLAIHFPQLTFTFKDLEVYIGPEEYDDNDENKDDQDDGENFFFPGPQDITFKDVHFDIVITARRKEKFVFDAMYARYSRTDRLGARSQKLKRLTESEDFCLLEFLMTNVKHFMGKRQNKASFLKIFNKLL